MDNHSSIDSLPIPIASGFSTAFVRHRSTKASGTARMPMTAYPGCMDALQSFSGRELLWLCLL